MLVELLVGINHVVACFYGAKINNLGSYEQSHGSLFRSSHWRCSVLFCVLKTLSILTEKYLCQNFQACTVKKQTSALSHLNKFNQSSVPTNKLLQLNILILKTQQLLIKRQNLFQLTAILRSGIFLLHQKRHVLFRRTAKER